VTEPLEASPVPTQPVTGSRVRGPLIHPVVASLTVRDLLSRRRLVLLVVLPLVLLGLAVTSRALLGADGKDASNILQQVGLGALLPLLALIAATGTLAPQIDDGSVVYLLAKPLSRHAIIRSQALVAFLTVLAFGIVPFLAAGLVVEGSLGPVTRSLAVGALAASAAYVAVFTLLSVVSRNAVLLGLIYALIWEGVVGGYVPGAKSLSIRQWGLSISESMLGAPARGYGVDSPAGLGTALVLLLVVTAGSLWLAGHQLRSLRLRSSD
jgi:ABC-2 type transport system permease protein